MEYILVENRKTVLLGPMPWRHRFIQSELDDLGINYTVSPTEPNGYLKITDKVEIFPATIYAPPHDTMYECLAGPFWAFSNNKAAGAYEVLNKNIDHIKADLKTLAANERYIKENTPFKMTVQDIEVTIDASRDNRNIFVQKYSFMNDNETVNWKFPETWLTLTKSELGSIVMAGATHIQTQFDWEVNISQQIDNATTIDALKQIVIVESTNNLPGV